MREITDKLFDEILENSGSQYFFHKLEDGLVEVVFKSGIRQVKPGEEDSAGRIWNPKLTDANGNPALNRDGTPREPWTKYEAEVTIKGVPHIYSFGGEKTAILKNFIMALKREEIHNDELVGTKWAIERIGQWDWRIRYLGKEAQASPSKPVPKLNPELTKIKDALSVKKDQAGSGIPKNDFIAYLAFVLHKKSEEVKVLLPELVTQNLIREENNLVYIV
jgi:hypothetical protein